MNNGDTDGAWDWTSSRNFPFATAADGMFENRNIDGPQIQYHGFFAPRRDESPTCIAIGCWGTLIKHGPEEWKCIDCGRVFTRTLAAKLQMRSER
jgi:hypothetical protein